MENHKQMKVSIENFDFSLRNFFSHNIYKVVIE